MGRALSLLELYRRSARLKHVFAIDEVLWRRRSSYYAALHHAETNLKHDLTAWIQFIAEAFQAALEQAWERLQLFGSKREHAELVLTPRQEALIRFLRENAMSILTIQKSLQVTKPGAHYILKPLLAARLVERVGGHRTGVYRLRT